MTKEEIIRMAREAGYFLYDLTETHGIKTVETDEIDQWLQLERFAALVAAAERNSWPAEMEAMERQVNILTDALAQAKAEEREACAKLCEPKRPRPCDCEYCDCGNSSDRAAVVDWDASNALAAAIRARGQA